MKSSLSTQLPSVVTGIAVAKGLRHSTFLREQASISDARGAGGEGRVTNHNVLNPGPRQGRREKPFPRNSFRVSSVGLL